MTITLDLKPDQQQRLSKTAAREGLSVQEYLLAVAERESASTGAWFSQSDRAGSKDACCAASLAETGGARPRFQVRSPRLARREDVADFVMEVIEEPDDAVL